MVSNEYNQNISRCKNVFHVLRAVSHDFVSFLCVHVPSHGSTVNGSQCVMFSGPKLKLVLDPMRKRAMKPGVFIIFSKYTKRPRI